MAGGDEGGPERAGSEKGRPAKARAPKSRLSAEKRARFLGVLGETGNRVLAAEAIGADPRSMDQRREFDALLDREWKLAVEQADRRLAGASGPLDCIGGAEPMVIRRGRGGKLKLVKAGGKRWSRPVEERFFAVLATCGTIAAAARAVGFSESCISQRRRKWPDFAQRLEEALEDAEVEIEFRFAAEVRGRSVARAATGAPVEDGAVEQGPLDLDAAMRFLKWREEKRHGRGRRGRIPTPPSIEAVTAKIVREVEAIKRQRARRERDGSGGTDGTPGDAA